jgi:hypothetical protein
MDLQSVLVRVAAGLSDIEDAEQLRKWILPTPQAQTVQAYLWLMCEPKVHEYLAPDIRQHLAERLTKEPAEEKE